ncbi:MAG: hypothetical protein SOT69_03220 [Mesosutterella sp.]|nr:hypothetical protein [Mesosutterella sp.]
MTDVIKKGEPNSTGYAASRLNAVKHGILSKELILPHESREEYDALLQGLQDEYQPQGITEGILVEELAAIVWRKRRVLSAERSKINCGLDRVLMQERSLANHALPLALHIDGGGPISIDRGYSIREIVGLSEEDFKKKTEAFAVSYSCLFEALDILSKGGAHAARKAVECFDERCLALWDEYDRDAESEESVRNFLEGELRPSLEEEEQILKNATRIRQQALGDSVTYGNLDSLSRYEAHLNRTFERTLGMLLKLKDMKQHPAAAPENAPRVADATPIDIV